MFPDVPLTSGLRKLFQPVPLLASSLVRNYRHLCLLLAGGEFNLSLTNTSSGEKMIYSLNFTCVKFNLPGKKNSYKWILWVWSFRSRVVEASSWCDLIFQTKGFSSASTQWKPVNLISRTPSGHIEMLLPKHPFVCISYGTTECPLRMNSVGHLKSNS